MADEREQQAPRRLSYQRNWYREATDCSAALAAAREENGRLREALEAIASCEVRVPGDVVSVARSALTREATNADR